MIELTDRTFQEAVAEPGLFILLLYASWCGPCHAASRELEAISERTGVRYGRIELTLNTKAVITYTPPNIPLILLYQDGQIVHRGIKGLEEEIAMRKEVP